MPIFVTGYVRSFFGKILGFLKLVNGHVSIVRANMSTKTPKQGSHTSAGHQHFTCQRSVSHTRIFDIEFLYLFYSRFPGSHCKPKTSKQLTCPDHMFAKTTFESLTCPAHDLTKKEKKTPLKGYVKNRESKCVWPSCQPTVTPKSGLCRTYPLPGYRAARSERRWLTPKLFINVKTCWTIEFQAGRLRACL